MNYRDKIAIITGGSKGIGEGCVRAFVTAGARVIFCARSEEPGQCLANEVNQVGPGEACFVRCDISKVDEIQQLIDTTVARYGRLDCLINNAGWHPPHRPIDDFSIPEFRDLLELNLVSMFAACKFALPHLRYTQGNIINADNDSNTQYRYGPNGVKGVTVLEGIKNKLGSNVTVNYARGCEIINETWPETEVLPEPLTAEEQNEINKAVDVAKKSELAIVVLGDSSKTVGESASRSSLDLPGRQLELVQAIYATGKPVIVVLINGRPISINWVNKYIPGILEAWFPGAQGGPAIADVLFGDYNPGGKLTITFPRTVGQIPYNFPTKPNAQWEGEKTRVSGALYSFGHGLSYTTFAYSNLTMSPLKQSGHGNVLVTVDVKNTGAREGDEVPQLYVHDLVSSVTTYEKVLRGFQRVHLKPGEFKTLTFTLTPEDLALWDRSMRFVVEPGMFKVMLGSSSEDIRLSGEFEIVGP